MGSFFAGIAVAIVLALVGGFGLNIWDLSTAEAILTTEDTVL